MADRLLGIDIGVSAAKLALLEEGALVRTQRIDAHRFRPEDLLSWLSPAPACIAATGMGAPARHLGGSGVGGGTLLGLSSLMGDGADAQRILEQASCGDLRRIDLCIGDVTDREIPGLPPCTTVANFAHLHPAADAADRARGVVNLVCQTVGVMAAFAARAVGVEDVVLVGTPVAHPAFAELTRMVELLHPIRFHVPPQAPFAAAIGAARIAGPISEN